MNDWSGVLSSPLAAATGAGGTISVTPLTPGLSAGQLGSQARARIGTEIVTVTLTTATSWTIVAREAEDATRYPKQDWPAGTLVDLVLTAAGLTALGQLLTGKTLTVDIVNGNDATAARGDAAKPFLTLAAAKAAALAGDLTHARPESYTFTAGLEKNGVNWHFDIGCSVLLDHPGDPIPAGIWNTDVVGCTYRVTGHGSFTHAASSVTNGLFASVVAITHASSDVEVNGLDLMVDDTTLSTGPRAVYQSAGKLTVRCRDITTNGSIGTGGSNTTGQAVWWDNGETHITARKLFATDKAVYGNVTAAPTGDLYVTADDIEGNLQAVYDASTNADAAMWVRAGTIRNMLFGTAIFANGNARVYVECQKVFGRVSAAGPGSGQFYLRADKVAPVVNGLPLFFGSTCSSWVSVNDWDSASLTGNTLQVAGGTHNIFGGVTRPGAAANGLNISSGTARLHGTRIDTSLNTAGNPVTKSGGTLVLHDCTLVAAAGRNSIEAATPQTVIVEGTLTVNAPVHANVTLTGGLLVRSDTGAVTANGPVTATAYISPVSVRQSGGVAGTDQLDITHDGTTATLRNRDTGGLRVRNAADTVTTWSVDDAGNVAVAGTLTAAFDVIGQNRVISGNVRFELGQLQFTNNSSQFTGPGLAAFNNQLFMFGSMVSIRDNANANTVATFTPGTGSTLVGLTTVDRLNSVPLTPAQLTADQNDYAPGAARTYRLSANAARVIGGLVAGADGEERTALNVGSFAITLSHENVGSAAANRFLSTTGANLVLAANEGAGLLYDATTARWRAWKL